MAQQWLDTPTLGEGFIQDQPPFKRVVAVPSQHHFIFDMYWKFITARLMPVYSTPGSFDENGVVILSDLDIFYDNRPATTSGSGSIVPLPFDDSDFSVDDLPY